MILATLILVNISDIAELSQFYEVLDKYRSIPTVNRGIAKKNIKF